MSTCIIASGIFGLIMLFSVKNRRYARDALHCLMRYTTFRLCDASLHDRVRATVISRLMINHMGLARFMYRHFEIISWVFIIFVYAFLGCAVYGVATCIIL